MRDPTKRRSLSWIDYFSGFECSKTTLGWLLELICDLLLREFDPTNGFANEVGDMDCASIAFLSDWLLILCEPHAPAILICMKYGFVLHNQDVLLLPWLKHWWNAIERCIIVSCHQAVDKI